jgi:MinD superfamily P-loop ATPase
MDILKIAVLSGKGGTGKTTIAASLAKVIPGSAYVDCDVEEPNGFLFLNPDLENNEQVLVPVPEVDADLCTGCGDCVRICQFNALALVRGQVIVFPELCHHCGACALVCKPMAITEEDRSIGTISWSADASFFQGKLNIGEPAGIPIIRLLKKTVEGQPSIKTAILDCSPGASCAVVNSLEGSDYALIVTEPTPFGLHDLKIAVDLVKQMKIRAGVIINKSGERDEIIEDYCSQADVPVLLKVPYLRKVAEEYARGILPVETNENLAVALTDMYTNIRREVKS